MLTTTTHIANINWVCGQRTESITLCHKSNIERQNQKVEPTGMGPRIKGVIRHPQIDSITWLASIAHNAYRFERKKGSTKSGKNVCPGFQKVCYKLYISRILKQKVMSVFYESVSFDPIMLSPQK